jgi:cell division transport system permease protein
MACPTRSMRPRAFRAPPPTASWYPRRGLGQTGAPAARVDAQARWLSPVFGAIDSLQWLSAAMVGLLAVAMCAAVLLAARSALGQHRNTIAIVHMLGGTDGQIARIFQRAIGMDAAAGAALGMAVAVAVVSVLGRKFAGLGAGLVAGGALGWVDWLLVALVPLVAVGLAVGTVRISVLKALGRML